MASTSSSILSISSSSTPIDGKAPRQPAVASPPCVSLPTLPPPPVQSQNRPWKATSYCRKLARNVMAMAAGEAAEVATAELPEILKTNATTTGEAAPELSTTELPEILKTVQEAWDKVEDKYAVSALAVAGVVALIGSTGLISAIDRLPLIPGVLEIVGIGYTGWFAYKNIVFKPDREALIAKVKSTYNDIIGS